MIAIIPFNKKPKPFEEFKQHYQIFARVDTPQGLESCMSMYGLYLIDCEEADNFFSSARELDKKLPHYAALPVEESQFILYARPSFSESFQLIFSKSAGEFCWEKEAESLNDNGERSSFKGTLDNEIGEVVYQLADHFLQTAKPKKAKTFPLDGDLICLAKWVKGEKMCVARVSPDEDAPPGKFVELLTELSNSTTDAAKIASLTDELLHWMQDPS